MFISTKVRSLVLCLGLVGTGSVAMGGCYFEPLHPGDVADAGNPVADAGTPVTDNGPAVDDDAGTPPTDNGNPNPFRCPTPGAEIDPRDCLDFAVTGTTHSVCNATGDGTVCMLRPGCTIRGCVMAPVRVCDVPGAELDPRDCQPGAAPGTTHTVCNGDGSARVCVLRPGCALTGCIQAPVDGGVPVMPTDAGTVDPGQYVTTDETCNGRTLTGMPAGCADLSEGRTCWHVCQITPVYLADSNHPNAGLIPGSIRLIQAEDPSRPLDIGTTVVPTLPAGIRRWEAGAYVALRPAPAGFPLFNGKNTYERAVSGPFAYLWSAGQNYRGMGLDRNGLVRIYRVNANLTQTLAATEIVANEPANDTTAAAYYNGGNFHPLGTGCPFYLTERTTGLYRCSP